MAPKMYLSTQWLDIELMIFKFFERGVFFETLWVH